MDQMAGRETLERAMDHMSGSETLLQMVIFGAGKEGLDGSDTWPSYTHAQCGKSFLFEVRWMKREQVWQLIPQTSPSVQQHHAMLHET